jgi:voltage-gated potassium channel
MLAAGLYAGYESKTVGDSLWWAMVTSLTIGYGDMFPVTTGGRIVGAVFSHFWILLIIPMVIGNIITHMLEDKNEFTDGEQRELFNSIKNIESILQNMVNTDGENTNT